MALPSYVGRYEVRQEIARGGFAVVETGITNVNAGETIATVLVGAPFSE